MKTSCSVLQKLQVVKLLYSKLVNLISWEEYNVGPMLKYCTLGLNIVFYDRKRKNNKETSKKTSKETNKNRFPWSGKITISIISVSMNYQLLIKNRKLFLFFFFFFAPLGKWLIKLKCDKSKETIYFLCHWKVSYRMFIWTIWPFFSLLLILCCYVTISRRKWETLEILVILYSEPCDN